MANFSCPRSGRCTISFIEQFKEHFKRQHEIGFVLKLNIFNNSNIQESKNTLDVRYHKASTNTKNVPIPREILFLLFQNVSLNSHKN